MPHQCAHWFAMTCRRKDVCAGARPFGAQGVRNAGACRRVQGRPPIVIARSEATGQSVTLRQDMAKGNTLGEYERCCGFAQSIANLLAFPAGTRIAAPVCALVRNDMQKTGTCSRVQGRPPIVIARSEATGQSASPAGKPDKLAAVWVNSLDIAYSPKVLLAVMLRCKENGLPHQCAHWFAMTCKNL